MEKTKKIKIKCCANCGEPLTLPDELKHNICRGCKSLIEEK